jgi:hypothetical protein
MRSTIHPTVYPILGGAHEKDSDCDSRARADSVRDGAGGGPVSVLRAVEDRLGVDSDTVHRFLTARFTAGRFVVPTRSHGWLLLGPIRQAVDAPACVAADQVRVRRMSGWCRCTTGHGRSGSCCDRSRSEPPEHAALPAAPTPAAQARHHVPCIREERKRAGEISPDDLYARVEHHEWERDRKGRVWLLLPPLAFCRLWCGIRSLVFTSGTDFRARRWTRCASG